MFLYIGVAIWPLLVGWLYNKNPKSLGSRKLRTFCVFISIVPIFVMLAFRGYYIGADTGLYQEHFFHLIDTPLETEYKFSRMEIGYLMFEKGITHITQNPLYYQLICMTISWIGITDFMRTLDDEDVFLFLYIYCTIGLFFFMFTGVRQVIAMSICMLSYRFIERKKWILVALLLFVAFYIHKSSILFAIIIVVMHFKVTIVNTIIYLVGALIAGRFIDRLQGWFNDQLDYDYEVESTSNGLIFLIVLLLLTIFSLVVINKTEYDDISAKRIKHLTNINFITVFFWIVRLQTRVAERPSYYFMFFSCALFATAINKADPKTKTIYKIVICTLLMVLYIYRLKTNFASFVPYEFYQEGLVGHRIWGY